jgi:hypothetical protein
MNGTGEPDGDPRLCCAVGPAGRGWMAEAAILFG